jgi:hypothetical protein
MASPLAAVERFFERLFERQTARLFRTKLQPIQLQRRVERAMESNRRREGERTVVPDRYAIHLAPDDLAALSADHPELAAELADATLAFARSHGYTLAERPVVALVPDTSIQANDALVTAAADPGGIGVHRRSAATPLDGDAAGGAARQRTDDDAGPPPIERTAVFVVPTVDAPRAVLREIRPDGSSRSVVLDGRPLTIGRGPDNGLVLTDGRASRHHARLFGRRGALILADSGSTNGSWVNDRRIDEMALGEGDQIRIGDTILVVESVEPGDAETAFAGADPAGHE